MIQPHGGKLIERVLTGAKRMRPWKSPRGSPG